mmetsp:Transcript_25308/g.64343  ORF Transcript_25308/g.64343 Transcript_25308/m.64343 type:complete len:210 (-) Transcript_25308:246-875(-)
MRRKTRETSMVTLPCTCPRAMSTSSMCTGNTPSIDEKTNAPTATLSSTSAGACVLHGPASEVARRGSAGGSGSGSRSRCASSAIRRQRTPIATNGAEKPPCANNTPPTAGPDIVPRLTALKITPNMVAIFFDDDFDNIEQALSTDDQTIPPAMPATKRAAKSVLRSHATTEEDSASPSTSSEMTIAREQQPHARMAYVTRGVTKTEPSV